MPESEPKLPSWPSLDVLLEKTKRGLQARKDKAAGLPYETDLEILLDQSPPTRREK